ncbi:MAG: hypothetical protein LBH80_00750 [Prevotellaceae bacterium]|jgi:multisubunit Na+/H+ antiporter MnhG subunit|nr:hypothetical protein [Prevotellaceae bacterium]
MENLLKYLGAIIILIGVVILAIYALGSNPTNGKLIAAIITMLVGFAAFIVANKVLK